MSNVKVGDLWYHNDERVLVLGRGMILYVSDYSRNAAIFGPLPAWDPDSGDNLEVDYIVIRGWQMIDADR